MNARTVFLVAATLLALCLRLFAADRFSLNNDEIAEVSWTSGTWTDCIRAVAEDRVHPPLDYLLQWSVGRISDVEWHRRLPSIFAGTATVLFVAFLGPAISLSSGSLVAAAFLAISPTHIRFSQEIRPYAMGLFFLAASILSIRKYIESNRRRYLALWFAATLCAGYTLYFAGMVAGTTSVVVLLAKYKESEHARRALRRIPMYAALLIVLYLPWMNVLISAAAAPPVAPQETIDLPWLAYRLQVLGTGDWRREPLTTGSIFFWSLAALGLFVGCFRRDGLHLVWWLAGGMYLQLLILQIHPHFPAPRHLLPAWLAVFPLIGIAADFLLRKRGWRVILAMASATIVWNCSLTLRSYFEAGRPDWRRVAVFVKTHTANDVDVLLVNDWTARNFSYYWKEIGGDPARLKGPEAFAAGPAWIVAASCPMPPETKKRYDALPLALSDSKTNYLQIRILPAGSQLRFSSPCG